MASGAAAVIDGAQVFDTLEAAISDCRYVIATTARRRELSLPVLGPDEATGVLKERVGKGDRCAVLFGGERNGLSSDQVAHADAILSVPVNPAFASLNLAQAVLLVAYEWSRKGDLEPAESPLTEERRASRDEVDRLYLHLEAHLDDANYFFPPEMRDTMARNLRVSLTRANFTESEVRALHGVVKALAKRR
jgi:tRNA/rRNA methyltransferase